MTTPDPSKPKRGYFRRAVRQPPVAKAPPAPSRPSPLAAKDAGESAERGNPTKADPAKPVSAESARSAQASQAKPASTAPASASSTPQAPPSPSAARSKTQPGLAGVSGKAPAHDEKTGTHARPATQMGRDREPGAQVTVIPPLGPGKREIESIPVIPDRAWVRIVFDEKSHTYTYEAIEPQLSADESKVLTFLRDTLIRTLDGRQANRDRADWPSVLVDATRQAVKDHAIRLDDVGMARVEYYLLRDFLGYGPVDVLIRDGMIEDISCDGPKIPIYLFHRKYESLRTNIQFDDELVLDGFVVRLAQRSGKHISVADPLLDATLPDGSRLQATLSREVTTRGSSFTIRKFRADPLTPPDLIRYGTMSAQMAAYFWFVMEAGASFILAGGTASGKTTTLNAVSQFIPPEKKIVSIEDTREINLSHENWIAGITRSGFGGDTVRGKPAGSIDMYKLLEAALRQRPEYLLVGEVRGAEALTLFQAMATGHAVYSTMHADSVPSAVYRLESEPINVPRMMLQTLDILAIQTQVRIQGRMTRRLSQVTELIGMDPDTKELLTNTVFDWDSQNDAHRFLGKSQVLDHMAEMRNLTEDDIRAEWKNRTLVMEWMVKKGMRHYADVADTVSKYYRDPKRMLEQIAKEG